ncbi:MAG: G1 family glutamic endopeptidase [Solirubrobacteraceae bacterium]
MRRIRSAGAGVAVLLGMLFSASAAVAQGPALAASSPLEGHVRRGLGASESTNWSGYADYGSTFTAVQGDWVQPAANCEAVRKHGYALAAFWVGLDGYEDNTVEQTGTEADCEGATPVYYAWSELYPQSLTVIEHPVNPGDQMHAQVTQDELVLEDRSAGWTSRQSFLPGSLSFSSAEWIAEAPAQHALTDFGSVHFSSASASSGALAGGAIESGAWSDEAITLAGGHGRNASTLATPGALEEASRAFTIEEDATGVTHGH